MAWLFSDCETLPAVEAIAEVAVFAKQVVLEVSRKPRPRLRFATPVCRRDPNHPIGSVSNVVVCCAYYIKYA